ncbi:MAG: CRISPR-associated protein Cas4 [Candidatus Hodarchaeales archaeon]
MIGVQCTDGSEITFEECMACGKCLPAPYIKALKQYNHQPYPGSYGIRELVGCLRAEYLRRITDPKEEYIPLEALWKMKRGKLLEKISDATGYNELEGIYLVDVDGEQVEIRGKLDCYNYQTKEIIETKTTRLFDGFKPHKDHVLQLQCYITLYKTVFSEIKGLKLVYFDLNKFRMFEIPMDDQTEFLEKRVKILHKAILKGAPPLPEYGHCKYCKFKTECDSEYGAIVKKELKILSE